ncbi:hypothetical protein [Gimesia sp.]|uniref:hypothetical protein n=1 Tax=Gimesia sp. TaxID=2024833 RepID=UPI0032EEA160
MPYILRKISHRQFKFYDFIRNYYRSCKGWPTLENICCYFHASQTRTLVTLEILKRHHFIEDVGGRYQAIDRNPLVMPFRGIVR